MQTQVPLAYAYSTLPRCFYESCRVRGKARSHLAPHRIDSPLYGKSSTKRSRKSSRAGSPLLHRINCCRSGLPARDNGIRIFGSGFAGLGSYKSFLFSYVFFPVPKLCLGTLIPEALLPIREAELPPPAFPSRAWEREKKQRGRSRVE